MSRFCWSVSSKTWNAIKRYAHQAQKLTKTNNKAENADGLATIAPYHTLHTLLTSSIHGVHFRPQIAGASGGQSVINENK